MADDGIVGHGGADGPGGHVGGGGDEAVHGDGQPTGGRADDQAGQAGDFQPAQAGQDGHRVAAGHDVRVQGKPLGHDGRLAAHAPGVQARARAGDLGRGKAEIGAEKRGGRRGVGDAHVAGAQGPHAFGGGGLGQGHAKQKRALALLPGHGRGLGQIGRARGHPRAGEPGMGGEGIAQAAGVHHPQVDAGGGGQDVDARAAGQEIGHHLTGDFLGKKAHASGGHAVVPGADVDAGRVHGGFGPAADDEQPGRQFFQASQAAARFGEVVEMGLGHGEKRLVHRPHGGQDFGQGAGHGDSFFGCKSRAAGRIAFRPPDASLPGLAPNVNFAAATHPRPGRRPSWPED